MGEAIIGVIQKYSWVLLILILVFGWYFPILMFISFVCMIAPVIFSFWHGRAWCGNFCPRGSLNNRVLKLISPNKHIPWIIKSPITRLLSFAALMTLFTYNIIQAKGNIMGIGLALIKMMALTSIIEICMGIFIHQNSWCYICPMGSVASLVSKIKGGTNGEIIFIRECKECSKCIDNCPMQINIPKYSNSKKVQSCECIKCRNCVINCPNKALIWNME